MYLFSARTSIRFLSKDVLLWFGGMDYEPGKGETCNWDMPGTMVPVSGRKTGTMFTFVESSMNCMYTVNSTIVSGVSEISFSISNDSQHILNLIKASLLSVYTPKKGTYTDRLDMAYMAASRYRPTTASAPRKTYVCRRLTLLIKQYKLTKTVQRGTDLNRTRVVGNA